MEVIELSEARKLGLKRYFTGRPCKHGHVDERLVSNGTCHPCYLMQLRRCWDKNKGGYNATRNMWNSKNRPLVNERTRASYRKSPEGFVLRSAKWAKKNPEAPRSAVRNRRARQKAAKGIHTNQDIYALFQFQRGVCFCGFNLSDGYHVDHVVPISRGGSNWPSNLQLLCATCNCSKGTKLMEEWIDRPRPWICEPVRNIATCQQ